MHDVIYTPFDLSDAIKAGRRRFWKQVLPVTKIQYKGQEVDFDSKFHLDLAQAFEDKAFDQVPIVFANGENSHNMDPRNFGGDVLHMEYRGEKEDGGTWALIEADKKAAKEIERNPKLGVSARIRQALEKADGRTFDRAIEHICLTMNPRVTGMSPWQAVDLSEDDADIEVVDLTAFNYEEGNEMGTKAKRRPKSTSTGTIDLSALDDEQFQTLLDLAQQATLDREDEEVDEEEEDEMDEVEETSPVRNTKKKKSKKKITIENESEEDEDDDEEEEEEAIDETDLSDSDKVIRANERSQFQQMRYDMAEQRWDGQRDAYTRAGVPPFLLDLAEPILSLPDAAVIDLADDETIDATDTIRKMLDGVKGVVDLADEMGHQIDLSVDKDQQDEADQFLGAWDKQYG